jgi:hypothetical protein
MGLWDSIKAIGRGESFSTAAGYAFVPGAEIARGRELDARLTEENRIDFERGRWDFQTAEQVRSQASTSDIDNWIADPATNPWAGFKEGAAEGLANMQAGVKNTAGGLLAGALGFVPWWLWLVAAGWLLWRLGLLGKLLPANR